MLKTKHKSGFTLIELIVVITILAILGTIAFIALQGYSKSARDSARVSDMWRMKTALEMFAVEAWMYPDPANGVTVTYSGGTMDIWEQWFFWQVTFNSVSKLDKIPVDPVTDNQYIYSRTSNKKQYQLGWMLETEDFALWNTNKVHAADDQIIKVTWSYNWVTLTTWNNNNATILAIPSLINLCWTTLEEIATNNYFMYDWFKRFPKSYNGISTYDQCDWTSDVVVNPTKIKVFEWDIADLLDENADSARAAFLKNIQDAYTGTKFAADDQLRPLLAVDTTTDTSKVKMYTDNILSNKWAWEWTSGILSSSWGSTWTSWGTTPLTPEGWMLVDPNCDKSDIVIWTQTWAWCNSTIWTWIEFSETDIESCVAYGTDSTAISATCNSTENASEAKENAWNSTYWIDAIWGKLYTHSNAASACSDWYHLPTTWEYNQLLNDLTCVSWLNDINDWNICYGLWWKDKNLKTNNNNLVNALWIPLAGYKNSNWDFRNRWLWTSFWSSSLSWTGAVSVNMNYAQDFLTHTATDKSLALSVRCIKDGTTPSITAKHPAWYAYIDSTNELAYYDITWWTDLTIPNGVTSIWKNVFLNLGMTSINLPSTLTMLKEGSLYGNNLTTITIPDSVTTIWSWALAWNESMTSVNLWTGLTTIDDYAFDSSSLTSLVIPNNVTTIWNSAFEFNNISTLTLWNSLTTIWENAFGGYEDANSDGIQDSVFNSISTLTIPSSVTSIWWRAFTDNALSSITFEADVANIWPWAFNYQDIESVWNWTIYWPASGNIYDILHVSGSNYNSTEDDYYFDDVTLPNYITQ